MVKRLTIEIDERLRNKVRSKAIMSGKSLKELITEYLENYIGA